MKFEELLMEASQQQSNKRHDLEEGVSTFDLKIFMPTVTYIICFANNSYLYEYECLCLCRWCILKRD